MSWLYDDQDLSHRPEAATAETAGIHPTEDFELFHEHVAPIDVGTTDLTPVASDQGIKHVRVRNLQWWTNENALRELLTDCGIVKSIEFEASMKNGKSLGIANIEFDTSDAALRAIDQIDNREIDGKIVNANLLMVEDVKVSASQLQPQRPPHSNSSRKLISPRRSMRPVAGTGPGSRELHSVDLSRQLHIPTREGSSAKAGKSSDHRQEISTPRGPDWGRPASSSAPFHAGNTEPVPTYSDRDNIRPRSSSAPDQPVRRREPEMHRDRERLIHGDRVSQRHMSRADPHPVTDLDVSRRSSYSDARHLSHSRRAEIDRSSRDLRSDHERSRHRSHRSLDDGRLSRRLHEHDKPHGSSSNDRHVGRYYERPETDERFPANHHNSDHRSRKRRR